MHATDPFDFGGLVEIDHNYADIIGVFVMTEERIRYLEMIQNAINSQATSSMTVTGWTVVLVSALFVLSTGDSNWVFACFAFLPVIAFWILDAYFLRRERLYRALYEKVRTQSDELAVDFSMQVGVDSPKPEPKPQTKPEGSFLSAVFSKTLLLFYGIMVITIAGVILITVLMQR